LVLLWLLAVAQGVEPRPQHDLTAYLAVAAGYRSANSTAALQEIHQWTPPDITAAVSDLQRREDRLRAVPISPDDIGFDIVEAAVLMHAEAGLLALQQSSNAQAEVHLGASTTLFEWSRRAAARARERASRQSERSSRSSTPPHGVKAGAGLHERIDRRDFYQALAATALAVGFPSWARPFAEAARRAAPLDAEVQLMFGCVAEGLAEEQLFRHRESEVPRLRDEADRAFRDVLALDPGVHEARLHLGRLLLVRGRTIEAELPLEEVAARTGDDRQRYLARLFLGRLAERRGRLDDAARSYTHALGGWPDSQAARLALAYALERSSGPAAARLLVAGTLAASRRLERAEDPQWFYVFGPPGLATSALHRVWNRVLGR
jgi:tetratricopeptide (TPR) repeat protein